MIVFKVSAARKEYELAQVAALDSDSGSVMCLSYRTKWVSPSVSVRQGDEAIIAIPSNDGEMYNAARGVKIDHVSQSDGVITFCVILKDDCPCDNFVDANEKYFVTTRVEDGLI